MQLLLVTHSSNVGGTEVCFGRALEYLNAAGETNVTIAAPQGTFLERWSVLAHRIDYAGSLPPQPRLKGYAGWLHRHVSGTSEIRRYLAAEKPDAVVVFTSVATGAVAAAADAGAPCICYVREFVRPAWVQDRLWRFLAKRCDRLIAVSAAIAEALEPYAPGRVDMIHDGVLIPEPDAAWPPHPPVVGCYAGYDPAKGPDVFVRAAIELAPLVPEARFRLYGVAQPSQTDTESRLREQVGRSPIADRFEFERIVGFAETYSANSIVVVPSRFEGLGLVALEAMAAGVPVLASATGGLLDIVDDPLTGRLFTPGDHEGLAASARELLGDEALLRATGEAARQRVAAHFTVAESMRGLMASIESSKRRA